MSYSTPVEKLVSAARAVALEASVNAGRLTAAVLAMDQASGPLRASSGGGIGGGKSDPTPTALGLNREGDGPTRYVDVPAANRRRVERIVEQQLALSRELSGIIAGWLPDEERQKALRGVPVTNDDIWCQNHRAHGMQEPRAPGQKMCDYCADFKRRHKGKLPNRWLLDTRSRRKINSADEAKAIADLAIEARAKKESA